MAPPTSPQATGVRVAQLRHGPHSASPCDSCKCPLAECRIIAKFVKSVHSPASIGISVQPHFSHWSQNRHEHHLEPSQHHQWTKMGLLIHSKNIIRDAQKDLGKNSRPGYCLSCRLCLVLFGNLTPLLPALASWMKCFCKRLFMKGVIRTLPGGSGAYGSLGVTTDLDLLFGYL